MHHPPQFTLPTHPPTLRRPTRNACLPLTPAVALILALASAGHAADPTPGASPGPLAASSPAATPQPGPTPAALRVETDTRFVVLSADALRRLAQPSDAGKLPKLWADNLLALCTGKMTADVLPPSPGDSFHHPSADGPATLCTVLDRQNGVAVLTGYNITAPSGRPVNSSIDWWQIHDAMSWPGSFQPPYVDPHAPTPAATPTPAPPPTPTPLPVAPDGRPIGVAVDLTPVLSPAQDRVDLRVRWEQLGPAGSVRGAAQEPLVFSSRALETSVSLVPGATLVLADLHPDPMAWRDPAPKERKYEFEPAVVLALITVRVADPSAQLIQQSEDDEEVAQPLTGPDDVAPSKAGRVSPSKHP